MVTRTPHDDGPEHAPLEGSSEEADAPRSLDEIDAALVRLISETEETVCRLRAELAERRLHQAQHAEIERLEHHLAEATVSWSKVREFFEEALQELTGHSGSVPDVQGESGEEPSVEGTSDPDCGSPPVDR
ncbi:hypothetical protein [Ruania alba]|uniref:Uncharacterized protein n=1 Tax=Ruania alba TaxID=648782 RepID=A0A1H5CGW5_9MICO|nr:hypothetical protein [Ruania alba]SED65855.1 hypothetical protein SAMN04488554_0366 [Ruania alba]